MDGIFTYNLEALSQGMEIGKLEIEQGLITIVIICLLIIIVVLSVVVIVGQRLLPKSYIGNPTIYQHSTFQLTYRTTSGIS